MLESLSQTFIALIQTVVEPFTFISNPGKRVYWGFLLSSAVLAYIVLRLQQQHIKYQIRTLFSRDVWLTPSSIIDVQWLFINHTLRATLILPLIGGQIGFALATNSLLESLFDKGNFIDWPPLYISLLFTVCVFIVDDFTRFLVHFLYHKVPMLWRFHAIHHSADILTPLTLYRIHFIESLINTCRSLVALGFVSGVFVYTFQGQITTIDILGISLFSMIFNLAGANLRHSSIWVSFGRFEKLFISPAQHQMHHSQAPQHHNINYGACLAIWDRLFASWQPSHIQPQKICYGIKGYRNEGILKQLFGINA